MTTITKTQPNYTTQSAAAYKAAIDGITAIHDRIAGMFNPHEMDVGSPAPDLAIRIDAGSLFVNGALVNVAAQTVTGFTVPSAGQERYDRVVINATTGVATRVAGTASTGSPSAGLPAITAGCLPCCYVRMTSSTAVITNSMIVDERMLANPASSTLHSEQSSGAATASFTDIPPTANWIDVNFSGWSSDNTSTWIVQIGDSGGYETSSYFSSGGAGSAATAATDGFLIHESPTAGSGYSGTVRLVRLDAAGTRWAATSQISDDTGATGQRLGGGSKVLSPGQLDRVQWTTQGGANLSDAGKINVTYG
jgi:hypothetical protein